MWNPTVQTRIKTAAAASILLLAAGCSKPEEKGPETVVPVQTAAVQRAPIQRIVRAQAVLYPADQAAIMPKISAPVRRFLVNRGDHVRKGQLLAELENRDLAAAALEAKGNYDQAEANYRSTTAASLPEEIAKTQADVQSTKEAMDAAEKVYGSRKVLLDQGALPRKELDEALVAYVQARSQHDVAARHLESLQKVGRDAQTKAAQAQVEAALGHQQGADAQLEYSRINSPIDGVVTDRPLYAGEMASSGTPLLTVMDISRVIARANVPVNQLHFLKVGNRATINALDSSTEIQGKVTVVSPALDPNSTTAEVWVLAPNPGERLRPGSTVQVAVLAENLQDAVVIPSSALLPAQEGTGDTVLVVGPDSLAHMRGVDIGIRESDKVQVLKGLAPGEQVVTVGGFGLQDRTKVKVVSDSGEKSEQNDEPKPKR
jgi:multidrug efflux pump subunit AcrA (membrane-fusion protein)